MGPDEMASREELGLVLKFIFAKWQQQADLVSGLAELLISNGVISNEQLVSMTRQARESPQSAKASQALQNLKDFLAMHNIVQQYEDLPPEDL
jgi:hypothetical protein